MSTVYHLLSTVYCLLSTVYCPLHGLLSTVCCLLSPIHCLLSTVYFIIIYYLLSVREESLGKTMLFADVKNKRSRVSQIGLPCDDI